MARRVLLIGDNLLIHMFHSAKGEECAGNIEPFSLLPQWRKLLGLAAGLQECYELASLACAPGPPATDENLPAHLLRR